MTWMSLYYNIGLFRYCQVVYEIFYFIDKYDSLYPKFPLTNRLNATEILSSLELFVSTECITFEGKIII